MHVVAPTITQVTPRMLRRIDRRDAQQLATRESAKLLQRAAASVHAPMVSHDAGVGETVPEKQSPERGSDIDQKDYRPKDQE